MGVLEVVANVSEGRDRALVAELARSAERGGAAVLDVHLDPDHHRSVLTLAGRAGSLPNAVEALAAACVAHLDIRDHAGVHPRLGTLDVVPFVPLGFPDEHGGDVAARDARLAGAHLAEMGIPVFFYGALAEGGRSLPDVRREAFKTLRPDLGPATSHVTAGATALGVRGVLVAYNVDIDTDDYEHARRVAAKVREDNGGPPGVRALAFWLVEQGRMQISMNLTRPDVAGIQEAWEAVLAAGGEPVAAELVGLVPEVALRDVSRELLERSRIGPRCVLEHALAEAGLGLDPERPEEARGV